MTRSIDSDYTDLSMMGGFDMGINFDGFEENVKRIMELPIKYLDSAHDKAVELIEDVHAMLWDPFPDVIIGSSPTYVETKRVGENDKVSTPTSVSNVENGFTGCTDMDAHETESALFRSQENTSSEGDRIQAKDLCLLPEGTLTTEVYDSTSSEEIILWNPEKSVKPPRPADPLTEPVIISKDDYVSHALDTCEVTEQIEIHCSGHSDIPLENSSANYEEHIVFHSINDPVEATVHDVSSCAGDSPMSSDDTAKTVAIHSRNVQENMESDKLEVPYINLQQNTSFKKMLMRNISNKLWWSKKQTSVQQAVPAGAQDTENLGYELVSSSDDLDDDDWEIL